VAATFGQKSNDLIASRDFKFRSQWRRFNDCRHNLSTFLNGCAPFQDLIFFAKSLDELEDAEEANSTFLFIDGDKTARFTASVPDGWTSISDTQSKHWFSTLSVFDGPPQDLASLVPDNEENQDLSKTIWTFNKKKERPIWIACSYLKTNLLLAKELPLKISQCSVILLKTKPQSLIGLRCK
jgi:hypothetical protein